MIAKISVLVFVFGVVRGGLVLDGGINGINGGLGVGILGGGISSGVGVLGGGIHGGVGVVSGGHGVVDVHTPAHYEFKYGVEDPKTGDRKTQSEVRVNDVVKGEYSLAEPDGTIRIVKYTADDHNGFNAIVKRVGHAAHPQVVPVHTHSVVPVATHSVLPIAHGVVASHGISVGGIGLGGGLLGGRDDGWWGDREEGLGGGVWGQRGDIGLHY